MKPSVLLTFYRVMAYVTAVLLIVLCVAWGIELGASRGSALQQSGAAWTTTVGIAHGWLYMVYLLVALFITRLLRVPIGRMLLVLLAGTVPFGAFFAERKVVHWYRAWVREAGDTDADADSTRSARS